MNEGIDDGNGLEDASEAGDYYAADGTELAVGNAETAVAGALLIDASKCALARTTWSRSYGCVRFN